MFQPAVAFFILSGKLFNKGGGGGGVIAGVGIANQARVADYR
ncbi:MAG: hypothetical protein ABIK44_05500 [candidate division WOR-3 bacterium]